MRSPSPDFTWTMTLRRVPSGFVTTDSVSGGPERACWQLASVIRIEPREQVEEKMRRIVGNRATMEVVGASDPQITHVVEGFPTTVVSFGSDVPHLGNLGKRLLIGPGSILDAHTVGEKISKSELMAGADLYDRLVRKLLI